MGSAEVDPAKVGDILTNLLINAIKFTPDGGSIILSAESDGPEALTTALLHPYRPPSGPAGRRRAFGSETPAR